MTTSESPWLESLQMPESCGENSSHPIEPESCIFSSIFSRYMRQECINHKYSYGRDYPVGRLINLVGLKLQVCTQRYDRRPYGVGLLVAGYDVSFQLVVRFASPNCACYFRIKALTSSRHVQAPTSTIARQWPLVLARKALERTWKST